MLVVNALVGDYNRGYPPNRYYGTTCISGYENQPVTIRSRGTAWAAEGAFHPNDWATCKNNALKAFRRSR